MFQEPNIKRYIDIIINLLKSSPEAAGRDKKDTGIILTGYVFEVQRIFLVPKSQTIQKL